MTLSLDERRIAEIVQQVVADLRPADSPASARRSRHPEPASHAAPQPASGQDGVYPDIDAAIAAAAAAQAAPGRPSPGAARGP